MNANKIQHILMSIIIAVVMVATMNQNATAGLSDYEQIVTPDPNISCQPGWCLQYVQNTFGAPVIEPNATSAWENCQFKHTDRNFPIGCYVPIWFSVKSVPEGHVALLCPDGSVYSTSSPTSTTPVHHRSIDDIISYYSNANPLTYLGWSEDIETLRVVQQVSVSIVPTAPSVRATVSGQDVTLSWRGATGPITHYWLLIVNSTGQEVFSQNMGLGNSCTESFAPGTYQAMVTSMNGDVQGKTGYASFNIDAAVPTAPSVRATVSGQDVTLSWRGATGPITHYWLLIVNSTGQEVFSQNMGLGNSCTESFAPGTYQAMVTSMNGDVQGKTGYASFNIDVEEIELPALQFTPPAKVQPSPQKPTQADNIEMLFFVGQSKYLVNGLTSTMDTNPLIKDSRILLPVRFIAEPLGADTQWNQREQKVTITNERVVLELWIGKNKALVNGIPKLIDENNLKVQPLVVPPGRTLLPLRFISEQLGCDVQWIPELNRVKIIYSNDSQ